MKVLKVKVVPYRDSVVGVFANKRIEKDWVGKMSEEDIKRVMPQADVFFMDEGDSTELIDSMGTLDTKIEEKGEDVDVYLSGDPEVDPITEYIELHTEYLGKKASELHGPDLKILPNGHVVGSLPYVDDFKAFNVSNVAEQHGHYIILKLKVEGEKITAKINGGTKPNKIDLDFDAEWAILVKETTKTIEFVVDNELYIRLHLDVTLLPKVEAPAEDEEDDMD